MACPFVALLRVSVRLVVGFACAITIMAPLIGQGGTCSQFAEDFSGSSGHTWTGKNATWNLGSGKYEVKSIASEKLAYAESNFYPSEFFTLDVDVNLATFTNDAAVGIYPFTTGDVFLGVDGRTLDGVGMLYFGNGTANLFGWDVGAQEWYLSEDLIVSSQVTSVGLKYTSDSIILRINKTDTSMKVQGTYALAPSTLDKVWLVAQGDTTRILFDNVCGAPIQAPAAKKRLTVSRIGSGSGTVVSSPSGISCGSDCTEDFNQGTQVTLSATAASGSIFNGWSGGGCSGTGTCTVTMNGDVTVSAEFGSQSTPSGSGTYKLYFPYYQGEAGKFTGFAVSNNSTATAHLQFRAYGPNGSLLPFKTNPRNYDLPAHQQVAKLGHEIFGETGTTVQSGWVELTSDNPNIGSFFQVGGSGWMDGSVALSAQLQKLYFTRVFEGKTAFRGQQAVTYLSLANPNDVSITVRLNVFGSSTAEVLAPAKVVSIPAKGFLYGSISQLMGKTLSVASGYVVVEVTSGPGVVGFEVIQLPNRRTVIGLNGAAPSNTNELFSAQLANLSGFFTNVKLVNTTGASRMVSLTPIGEDGAPLASPKVLTLQSGAAQEQDVSALFGWSPSQPVIGSLRVIADSSGVIGDVIFGESGNAQYAAALPLQTHSFTEGVFSQVANGMGLFTGLAFYNPGSEAADVTVEVYSDTGTRTGVTQPPVRIEAGRRVSRLVNELVPASKGQVRGYVVVKSNQPLIAQQLFGAGNLLSAVPPTASPATVSGPGGSFITLADQAMRSGGTVTLGVGSSSTTTGSGQKAVSGAVKVTVSGTKGNEPMTGDGLFKLTVPLNTVGVNQSKLVMNAKVSTGALLPVWGEYNAVDNTYSVSLSGVEDGWTFGVVETPSLSVTASVPPEPGAIPEGWLTPPEWESCEFAVINHTNNVTQATINNTILPAIEGACSALSNAGFRSPKLWLDSRYTPRARIVHVVNNVGSKYFAPGAAAEETPEFSEVTRTEDQMHLLGQLYVDYAQFVNLNQQYGVTLPNIMIHELLHAVQYGYDIRKTWLKVGVNPNAVWYSPLKAYLEGTSTPIGQTFQEQNGSIAGPNVSVRRLHEGEFALLDEPIDGYKKNYYKKQDFFAWVAKKYNNGNWDYAHLLYEEMGLITNGLFGLSIDTYHLLYRQAMDRYFKRVFKKGLSEIYREFALDRAYEHSDAAKLRPTEVNAFLKNKLSDTLFSANKGLLGIVPDSADANQRQAAFEKLEPLSTFAVRMPVPQSFSESGAVPLLFELSGGQVGPESVTIHVFKEGATGVMVNGGDLSVTDISKAVQIPVDTQVKSLTVLVVNASVAQRVVNVKVKIPGEEQVKVRLVQHSRTRGPYDWWPGTVIDVGVDGTEPEVEYAEPGTQPGESCCTTYWSTLGGNFAVWLKLISFETANIPARVEFRGFTKFDLYTDDYGEERKGSTTDVESLFKLENIPFMVLGDGSVNSRTVRAKLAYRYYDTEAKTEYEGAVWLKFWVHPNRVKCELGYCESE